VLVDYHGPGVITRFWTAGSFDGDLEIFFDGAPEPSIRTTLREFFGGELSPFLKPVVMDCADSSQGRVSYLPIPFSRGCKIRSRSDTGSFYWQINATLYDANTEVATLPDNLDADTGRELEQVCARWRTANGLAFDDSGAFARVEVGPSRGTNQRILLRRWRDRPFMAGHRHRGLLQLRLLLPTREVDTPTHGCLDHHYSETRTDRRGRVSAYRLHLLDSVPFRQSLVLIQEAGCPRKGALVGVNGVERLVYRWTCYWYQGPATGEEAAKRDLLV
jgi:hypothetical protein